MKFVYLILTLFLIFGCKHKDTEATDTESGPTSNYSYPVPGNNATALDIFKYAVNQWALGNYEQTLKYSLLAYDMSKKKNDQELIAKLLNNIGLSHWKLGDFRSALESFEESARIAEDLGMTHLLALTYTNRSIIKREEEAYRSAKDLSWKAISLMKKIDAKRDLAISYNNHGQIFKMQYEMDSALNYYLKAAEIYDSIDFVDGKSATYGNLADVFIFKKQPKAIDYARQSLVLGLKSESKVRIAEGYEKMADAYSAFGFLDSALAYQQKYNEYQKNVYETNLSEKLAEYQSRMNSELQKLRIENLEKQNQITRNRVWMIGCIAFTILLCTGFLLHKRFLLVKAKERQLQADLLHSREILDLKQKELVSYILSVSEKNNVIIELQEQLNREFSSQEAKVAELIGSKILTDEDWEKFKIKFTVIFPGFLIKIRSLAIGITEAEVRYIVLNHLKLTPKEMSGVLGISDTTVHKYKMRLKKKLNEAGFHSVEDFISGL